MNLWSFLFAFAFINLIFLQSIKRYLICFLSSAKFVNPPCNSLISYLLISSNYALQLFYTLPNCFPCHYVTNNMFIHCLCWHETLPMLAIFCWVVHKCTTSLDSMLHLPKTSTNKQFHQNISPRLHPSSTRPFGLQPTPSAMMMLYSDIKDTH